MGSPSLVAKLGLDSKDFETRISASAENLTALGEKAKLTAAQIALLEKDMAGFNGGKGTQEQIALHKELQGQLRQTRNEYQANARQLAALNAVQGGPAGGAGSGHDGGNAGQLMHSSRAIMDMTLAGQSPVQAAMMEVPRVMQGMGASLGSTLLVGALGGLGVKLYEAHDEAKKLRRELDDLGQVSPDAASVSIGSIEKRLEAASTAAKHFEAASSDFMQVFQVTLGQIAQHPMTGLKDLVPAAMDGIEDGQRYAEAMVSQQTGRLVKRQGVDLALDHRREQGDPTEAVDRVRQKYKEERTEIMVKASTGEIDPKQQNALIEQSKEREEIAVREQQHRQQGAAAALALEKQILTVKRDGADVDVRIAQARLNAARDTRNNGKQQGPEYDANSLAIAQAKDALHNAERTAEIHRDELDTRTRIATFQGTADDKHLNALLEEESRLKRLLKLYKDQPDQQTGVNAALAQNQGAQTDFSRVQADRQDQAYMNHFAAGIGRGPDEARRSLNGQILNTQVEMRRNTDTAGNPKDPVLFSQQEKTLHDLKQALDDLNQSEKDRLQSIRDQTHALKEHGFEQTGEDKKKDIRQKYREQIDKATRNNDGAGVQAYTEQMNAALANVDADEAKLTPQQKRARDERNKAETMRRQQGPRPHTIDPSKGEKSWINDANGPDGSKIPQAGHGPHSAYDSPDNVDLPDNTDIPDNPNIPDVQGQDFNDLLNQNQTGYLDNLTKPLPSMMPTVDGAGDAAASGGNAPSFNHQAVVDAIHQPEWLKDGPPRKWFQHR